MCFKKIAFIACCLFFASLVYSMNIEQLKKTGSQALLATSPQHVYYSLGITVGTYYFIKNTDVSVHLYDYKVACKNYQEAQNDKMPSQWAWEDSEKSRKALEAWGVLSTTFSDTTPEQEIKKRMYTNVVLAGVAGCLLYKWYYTK